MSKFESHAVGRVRYFTYYLIFPGDHDYWVDQSPFVGDIKDVIKTTRFWKNPELARDLLKRGEGSFKDQNGVTHRIIVEDEWRPRNWGVRRKQP